MINNHFARDTTFLTPLFPTRASRSISLNVVVVVVVVILVVVGMTLYKK